MPTFRIYTSRSMLTVRLDGGETDIEAVGRRLSRDRFIVGNLVGENDQLVEPPVRILIPAQRIDLIAAEESQ